MRAHAHIHRLDSLLIFAKLATMCLISRVLPNLYTHSASAYMYWRLIEWSWMSDGESSYKWVCVCIGYIVQCIFGAVVIVHHSGNWIKQTDSYIIAFLSLFLYVHLCILLVLFRVMFARILFWHMAYTFRVVIKSLENARVALTCCCSHIFFSFGKFLLCNLVKFYHFSLPPINQFDKFTISWEIRSGCDGTRRRSRRKWEMAVVVAAGRGAKFFCDLFS